MIEDRDIPGADPAAVVEQYEPYLQKLANKYVHILNRSGAVGMEDLIQVGRIAIVDAQRKYEPDKGSFMNILFYCARSAMRRALGYNNQTGAAPEQLIYLDAPLSDDTDDRLKDTIQDPDAVPIDEPIIEDENRREISEQVRAAVDRMRSEKQRAAINLVWMEGKTRIEAADEMGIQQKSFYELERTARSTLRRDWRLKRFVTQELPFFHVSVSQYNTTWTSATEKAVLWRLEHLPQYAEKPQQTGSPADRIREIWNREHAEPV